MTNSHTDDLGGNRTPPPGIEVIGELPPGTPWWDAEELGFHVMYPTHERLLWFSFAGFLFLVSAGMFVGPFYESEPDFWFEWFQARWLVQAMGLVSMLIFVGMFFELTREQGEQVLYRLCGTTLEVYPDTSWFLRALGDSRDGMTANLVECYLAKGRNYRDEFWEYLFEIPDRRDEIIYEFVDDTSMFGEPSASVIKLSGCGLSYENLASLFDYRIAKAKGENPPPPEFS